MREECVAAFWDAVARAHADNLRRRSVSQVSPLRPIFGAANEGHKYTVGPDVNLDKEEIYVDGERLTEQRAEEIAEEVRARARPAISRERLEELIAMAKADIDISGEPEVGTPVAVYGPVAPAPRTGKNPSDMTEAELAEYYYEHRDDPDMWGEPVSSREPERLDTVISLRFTSDEAASLREAAKSAGINVSALLRAAALKAITKEGP
ncbi:MAG TPA: hypothetical protein VE326_11265 [Candidatus Binatia bacterium]|nr:hypothetical protein [Candidatus Binatia bacterium]